MSTLIGAGLLLFAAAAVADLAPWPGGVRRPWQAAVPYVLAAAGAGCLAAVGAVALNTPGDRPGLGFGTWLGFGRSGLVVDPLSGLFWLLTFSVAVAACLTAAGWAPGRAGGRGPATYSAAVLAAVAVVQSADNVFLFLMAWEALTVGFYLLASAGHRRLGAAVATAGFGKVSGAALLLGMLAAAAKAGGFAFADLARLPAGTLHGTVWVLLVLGFAIKVGLAPVQVWMPRGYAAAPAGLRPLMAGVAVNAGFYGLWRTLDLFGRPPVWLAVALLVVSALTALLGIAHAAVQNRLERVIAYSSVENAGLICTGYAVALVGVCRDSPRLAAVGLIAATLQVVAHAFAKSLLFAGAAGFESGAGTGDLERLRGAGRRRPWAGAAIAVGAVTLAGLPPTAGFVSEWFLLESLMQQFRLPHLPYALAFAVAGALVALTAGFASVTFVRIVGMIVLGPRRGAAPGRAGCRDDLGLPGRLGVLVLIVGGLLVAALTPLEIRVVVRGLRQLVPAEAGRGALKSPWAVQPVFGDFSVLSPSWLWVVLPLLFLATALLLLLGASRGSALRVRRTPAWRSAGGGVHGQDQYTPFGYANPTRRVLAGVLLTRSRTGPAHPAAAPRDATSATAATGGVISYSAEVVEVVEAYLYRPFRPLLGILVAAFKRLQSGRLDAYLAYMLVVLVALLALVAGFA
ncbi:proton-conducting transporter membrane subunit [Streptomyces sp. NPDC021020]|uniref:proton-conducting transporter transmembrane domain-containing protein n=1 Tax=Streptomyces sp. NPDC021020 TaxID=3365109 RepID=UPI0037A8F561